MNVKKIKSEFVPEFRRKVKFKSKPFSKHPHRNGPIDTINDAPRVPSKKQKLGGYKKAYVEYERIKAEQNQKREEAMKRKQEIKESLEKYKQKKREKHKKLAAKTRKGQPIMKNRIELLLEKIQSSKS